MEYNQPTLTNPELAVLGLVAEQPQYGYQLEQVIEQRGLREWTEIGFSSIYHILNKLEKTGQLAGELHQQGDRPPRKVYRITAEGRCTLAGEVRLRLARPRHPSGDFDLALANLPCLPLQESLAALGEYLTFLQERIAHVAGRQAAASGNALPLFVAALFDHALVRLRVEADWVAGMIDTLKQEIQDHQAEKHKGEIDR